MSAPLSGRKAQAARHDGLIVEAAREVFVADTHSITNALAGTFTPAPELYEMSTRAGGLDDELLARTHRAGVIRPDLEIGALGALFGQPASVGVGDPARDTDLPSHAPTTEERARQWVPA